MFHPRIKKLGLVFVLLWAQAALCLPKFSSPIVDEARLLPPSQKTQLEKIMLELHRQGGPQIGVNIVKELPVSSIEEYSIALAEGWQLGSQKQGNGILLVIAQQERQMRLEIGEGIEGEITDLESYQVIENILTPAFRKGEFAAGIAQFIFWTAKKFDIPLKASASSRYARQKMGPQFQAQGYNPSYFPFIIFFSFLLFPLIKKLTAKNHFMRGVFGGGFLGLIGFFVFTTALSSLLIFILIGFITGLIGIGNTLLLLAHTAPRRGGFGGGFGGSGGFGGGGGGGFSGGGASGGW